MLRSAGPLMPPSGPCQLTALAMHGSRLHWQSRQSIASVSPGTVSASRGCSVRSASCPCGRSANVSDECIAAIEDGREARCQQKNNYGVGIWEAAKRKRREPSLETYCRMSLACRNCHSAGVAAGASGFAKPSSGKVSACVATANSSRSLRFRDVTIALRIVSITKILPLESEKIALSNGPRRTCSHCAWIEAASTGRRARPQS